MVTFNQFNLYDSFNENKHIHYDNGRIEDFYDFEIDISKVVPS